MISFIFFYLLHFFFIQFFFRLEERAKTEMTMQGVSKEKVNSIQLIVPKAKKNERIFLPQPYHPSFLRHIEVFHPSQFQLQS